MKRAPSCPPPRWGRFRGPFPGHTQLSELPRGTQLTPHHGNVQYAGGQPTHMAVEEKAYLMSPRSAWVPMHVAIVMIVVLSAGCSTQHFTSAHPADVVASRIAGGWEHCAASGKLPVLLERQGSVYFVGVPGFSAWYGIPSGTRHSKYPVWAEVKDTDSGSATTYHKAFQVFSGKLDNAVRKS